MYDQGITDDELFLRWHVTVTIVAGSPFYNKLKPSGSVFMRFCKCIVSACRNRWNTKPSERKKEHWIDYADSPVCDESLCYSVSRTNNCILIIPTPAFLKLFIILFHGNIFKRALVKLVTTLWSGIWQSKPRHHWHGVTNLCDLFWITAEVNVVPTERIRLCNIQKTEP